jgi:hypothetical protein
MMIGMGIPTSHKSIPRMVHLQNVIQSCSTHYLANRSVAREFFVFQAWNYRFLRGLLEAGLWDPPQSHLENIRRKFTPQLRRPTWL